MTDETNAAPGGEQPLVSTPADNTPLSPREAFSALSRRRETQTTEAPVEKTVEPEAESPERGDAGPDDDQTPGKDTDAAEPADKPSPEPPRSWTKEEKEAFKALPPEHQQRIAERERAREVEIRRSQNEIAEHRKAATAERQQALQAKQHYEQALPQLLSTLQAQLAGEFADIKTWDDVQKMAAEDPLRYNQWHAKREQATAMQREAQAVAERQAREQQAAFETYASEQDKLASERIPELADPEKAPKATKQSIDFLSKLGFSQDELGESWNGKRGLSLRDARVQELIWKAASYDAAKAAVKTAVPAKPVAPVQRPGVAATKAETSADATRTLQAKLDRSGSQKDAFAYLQALRAGKG